MILNLNLLQYPINLLIFRSEPDLEFQGLLKRQQTHVKYFQGSLMNTVDLERTKVCGSHIDSFVLPRLTSESIGTLSMSRDSM